MVSSLSFSLFLSVSPSRSLSLSLSLYVCMHGRLGSLGFASFRGGAHNCGLWDQVAALEWVQQEIAGFGGDRDNVTIFGEVFVLLCESTSLRHHCRPPLIKYNVANNAWQSLGFES